ncbi:hypothetical protein [Halochromatium salexigens]|uniref:Uncharacterized protein n=1 Tax=Halochromatium salexigens TaxID=49447 RepID=A0AAJ0UIV5_HALSE|nr:hypothetical protein [Halochromatium salexigens]MBK5932304.1 hypothetical protein [Halochromatium salexigens]
MHRYINPDWRAALRAAGTLAQAESYQGETLNFESADRLFGRLTERRWSLVQALMGTGALSVRELARRLGRDVKRVKADSGTQPLLTPIALAILLQSGEGKRKNKAPSR